MNTEGRFRFRTDRHNNPAAFTVAIAKQAGLIQGVDYEIGDAFGNGKFHTARLLGDPIAITIKVIDKLSFYTGSGAQRWDYLSMPRNQWLALTDDEKRKVIGTMYEHEGGEEMAKLFEMPEPIIAQGVTEVTDQPLTYPEPLDIELVDLILRQATNMPGHITASGRLRAYIETETNYRIEFLLVDGDGEARTAGVVHVRLERDQLARPVTCTFPTPKIGHYELRVTAREAQSGEVAAMANGPTLQVDA